LLFFQAQAQCSSTFTASPTQLCQNQNSQIALSSAPIPGATYSWNFGNGSTPVSSSTTGPHIVTWNSSGVKTITLTVTNGSCTSTSTVTVDINGGSGAPAYLTNTPPTTGCVNTPITVQVAEGPASTVYSWSCDGCAPQPPSTTYGPVSISWSSPGTKTIAVTTSKPGCNINLTTTHVITIYAPMTATIISPANSVTCINQNVTFQANTGGGTNYSWNCSGCSPPLGNTSGPFTASWSSSGVKTVSLEINLPGCSVSATSVLVTVNQSPTLSLTGPNITCINQAISVTGAGTGTSSTYSWNCGGCTSSPPLGATTGTFNLSWSSGGTKTVTLSATTPGCTSVVASLVVTVSTPLTAAITSPTGPVACTNQNMTFQGNTGGGTNYSWNCDGCSPALGNTSGPFTASWTATGVKTVSLTINVPGCPPSSTQTVITLNTPPTVSLTGPNVACTDLPISVNSSGTGSSYTWNCAGCASSPPLGSTVGAFNLSWSSPGTKTITLSANQAGCLPEVATHVVTVYSGAPVSIIQPTNNANSCVNQNLSLQASTGAATYTWACDGCSPLPGSTSGPFNVSWSSAGTKTITVTASSPACNTSTASVEVVVNPPPTASISSPTPIITCIHTDITFQGTATGSSFNWNCAGCNPTPPASTGPFTVSWSNAGTKTITLTANNIGCATPAIATVIVTVLSPVSAVIISPSSPTACVNQNVTLQAQAGGTSYGWNCDGCFPAPSSTAGPHTVQWSGAGVKTINLTVTTQSCPSTTTSMLITVNASPVANIISPGQVLFA
jgi:PKD repeat protein